jgi:hypothetical protein
MEDEAMTAIEYLDRPPTGWFALDVLPEQDRKRDWVALMIGSERISARWKPHGARSV